jgi:hypothetical protein
MRNFREPTAAEMAARFGFDLFHATNSFEEVSVQRKTSSSSRGKSSLT